MLPGDANRNLPSFSELTIDLTVHFSAEEFATVELLLSSHAPVTDVNSVLQSLRAKAPSFARKLTKTALDLYFTHPIIITVLQNGRTTLFPYERSPAALDYDLLTEVYEQQRGRLS